MLEASRAEQQRLLQLEHVGAGAKAAAAQAAARADMEARAVDEGGDDNAAADETEPSGADSAEIGRASCRERV